MGGNTFGIDLGTSNIKIYSRNHDQIFIEKNMIAIENRNSVFAYGDSAFDMYEKAPASIQVSYPLSQGVIADIKNMQTLIKLFISDIYNRKPSPANYCIAVPTDITEVEKRAFYDLIRESDLRAKKIMIVEKAVADGLGMDIDIKNSQGVIVVDVGYETTEISILSLGGIVLSRLLKVGGAKFDESIRNAVRKNYSLIIGNKTAESIKMLLSELSTEDESALVFGRDIVTGLPVERSIPAHLVEECLVEHYNSIVDNIKVMLERTPPELAVDIFHNGIYLTGGASQVGNLASRIAKGTGLKVNTAEDPLITVASGLARIITDPNYKTVTYSIEGINK